MKIKKIDVLITYGWVRSSYAALRNLTTHGLKVGVADREPIGMCQWSRLKSRKYLYSDPVKKENEFVEDIVTICVNANVKMLLPSHDETEIIARNRGRFPVTTQIPIHDADIITFANNKARTSHLAATLGICVPHSIVYSSLQDLYEKLFTNKSQLVVKLLKGNSAKGVFYPRTNTETVDCVKRCIEKYNLDYVRYPIVQEKVSGEGWGVSCCYWQGERIAHFTHRRMREKILTGGTSTLRAHEPNQILETAAFAILDALKWHGLAMVEFKYDHDTGNYWFIEINPRLWGSLHLAITAGVEFPYLLFLCATVGSDAAKEYHKNQHIRYPWKARWYLGDVLLAVNKFAKGEIKSAIALLLPGNENCCDDVHSDDISAFFGEIIYYGYKVLKYCNTNPEEPGMLA